MKNISSQVIVLETCTLYRSTQSIILSDEYGCTGILEPGHKKLDSPEKLKFQPGKFAVQEKCLRQLKWLFEPKFVSPRIFFKRAIFVSIEKKTWSAYSVNTLPSLN